MFDDEFFPTPAVIAAKMISHYWTGDGGKDYRSGKRSIKAVLDPSAGKGDLLDWFKTAYEKVNYSSRYCGPKLYAVELNTELSSILQTKGHRLLGKDFLSYKPENSFDLIVMNPPFSEGVKHLLHAWDILKEGDIVCLLNAETIRNPYTVERKLLARIIEDHGEVEYLGPCFAEAERPTDVHVAMVRLKKPASQEPSELDFEFSFPKEEGYPDFEDDQVGTAVMRPDQMGAFIRRYDLMRKAFVDLLKAQQAIIFYGQGVLDPDQVMSLVENACSPRRYARADKEQAYENFSDGLRMKFWEQALGMLGIEKLLTAKMRENFRKYIEQQGSVALTKPNIYEVMQTLVLNSKNILDSAVVAVFDIFTSYHKCNRIYLEGWKTNARWKVGRKAILPNFVSRSFGWSFSMYRSDEYRDIDKAMCHLAGKRVEDVVTIEQALKTEWKGEDRGKCESEFFKLRYYLKGTLHLEFKDPDLWEKFNQVATAGKNWLGAHE